MKELQPKILLVILLLSAGLFFLDSQKLLDLPKTALAEAVLPVQGSIYRWKSGLLDAFSFITFWRSGEMRIKNLEQRNLELVGYKVRTLDLERENEELRAQLGVKSLTARRMLPVRVLGTGRFLEVESSRLLIDEGVREGQSVVYLDNLIGRVTKVFGRVAFVQILRDSESKVPSRAGRSTGLVTGRFDASIVLTQVAQNEELREGDLVVSSGEGLTYSSGLVVGKVGKIRESTGGIFKEADVISQIDLGRLSTVFIILD